MRISKHKGLGNIANMAAMNLGLVKSAAPTPANPDENWIPSSGEPGWQPGRNGREYQVVWQPGSGARGFLGRDDIVYFDQDMTEMYPYRQAKDMTAAPPGMASGGWGNPPGRIAE